MRPIKRWVIVQSLSSTGRVLDLVRQAGDRLLVCAPHEHSIQMFPFSRPPSNSPQYWGSTKNAVRAARMLSRMGGQPPLPAVHKRLLSGDRRSRRGGWTAWCKCRVPADLAHED